MEVVVEGEEISKEEYNDGSWTALEAQRRCARQLAPAATASEQTENNEADTAQGNEKKAPKYRARPPFLPKRKPLPKLPPGDYKVILRPQTAVKLLIYGAAKLFKAVCAATQVPIEDAISEDQVRVHPNSNTALISTPSRARAEGYNNIKILKIGQEEIEVVAYAPAPENSTKGVIYYACSDETDEAIFKELQARNPSIELVGARRLGTKHIVAVFAGTERPEYVRYWGATYVVHPFKERIEACFNCRRTGHRADVCPQERKKRCKRCGEETHETPALGTKPSCRARCIVCKGGHPTGGRNCKYKYYSQVQHNRSTNETSGMSSIRQCNNGKQEQSRPCDTATQPSTQSTCYRDALRNNQPVTKAQGQAQNTHPSHQASSIKRARSSSRGRSKSRGRPTNRSISRARNQQEQRDARLLPTGARDETKTEGEDSNTVRELAAEVKELRKQLEAANKKIQVLENAKPASLAPTARQIGSSECRDSTHFMETDGARNLKRKLIEEDKGKHEDPTEIVRRVDAVESAVATISKEIDDKMRAIHTSVQETLKTFHEMLSSEIARMLSNVTSRDYSQGAFHLPSTEPSQTRPTNARSGKMMSTVSVRTEPYCKKDGGTC